MKTGDKLYCKNTFVYNGSKIHITNKCYTINHIDYMIIWINCESDVMPNEYCGYIIDKNFKSFNHFEYFCDHFCTLSELRKLKLKKLKCLNFGK
jgi:hypothetical protein